MSRERDFTRTGRSATPKIPKIRDPISMNAPEMVQREWCGVMPSGIVNPKKANSEFG